MAPIYIDRIATLAACPPAMEWLRDSNHPDPATAWAACPCGDWMLWLAGRLAGPPGHTSRIPLVLAACDCAELALVHIPANEERPRRAIETARAWARGEATLEEVRTAAAAAYDAAFADTDTDTDGATDFSPVARVTSAATYAVDAATSAADAAISTSPSNAAADAALAAAYAVAGYAADPTQHPALSQCADIVRGYYPTPPTLE